MPYFLVREFSQERYFQGVLFVLQHTPGDAIIRTYYHSARLSTTV